MRKAVIEEVANGFIVRFTKYCGEDIIENSTLVFRELSDALEEAENYFNLV